MAIVKMNPWTEKTREKYFNLVLKMKSLMGQEQGDDIKYFMNIMTKAEYRLKCLEAQFFGVCKHCGKPSMDFMSCGAKEFKANCEPEKQVIDMQYYWDTLCELPGKPTDED